MSQKCKHKKQENEIYEVQITDWIVECQFGMNLSKKIYNGNYSETASLLLTGQLILPELKNIQKAQIRLFSKPELDNHWIQNEDEPFSSIGYVAILRDQDQTMEFMFNVPSRIFSNIMIAAGHNKIKFASVYGTKLKWRKGIIFWISFYTLRDRE